MNNNHLQNTHHTAINIICYDILVMVVWFFCSGVQAYCSSSTTAVITQQQQLNHR